MEEKVSPLVLVAKLLESKRFGFFFHGIIKNVSK